MPTGEFTWSRYYQTPIRDTSDTVYYIPRESQSTAFPTFTSTEFEDYINAMREWLGNKPKEKTELDKIKEEMPLFFLQDNQRLSDLDNFRVIYGEIIMKAFDEFWNKEKDNIFSFCYECGGMSYNEAAAVWKAALEWVLNDNDVGYEELDEYDRATGIRCVWVDDIEKELEE